MTRTILTIPLLAACACPLPDIVCDPVTDICVCTGPTGTVAASGPSRDDRARAEPESPPERPTEPEKEPEHNPEPEKEPEREEPREEPKEGY